MFFGSKYVYDNNDKDDLYEYVSDDELEQGLSVSDDSDEEVADSISRKAPKKKKKHHWKTSINKEAKREATPGSIHRQDNDPQHKNRFRRADTNVVSVKLNKLTDPGNMHAGDAIRCKGQGCSAVLSNISTLTAGVSGKIWQCEFCGTYNEAGDVEEGEIPKDQDVTFLLEAAPVTASAGPSGIDESIVVFCIDVSGSMCVTTEVPGKIVLRSSDTAEKLRRTAQGEDQHLPRERHDVTNISRLQFMQEAVDKQLQEFVKNNPNRRVAIIAFNNELRVMGDGQNTDQVIAGKKLEDKTELSRLGSEIHLPKPIKETRKILSDKIFELEEQGATALGPSLVVAMGLASRYAGSKIILCTDGLANVGLGRLDIGTTEEHEKFYDEMGVQAVEKGVSISVITIQGTDSKLVHLGKLADKTNGQVNRVDPMKLTDEFSNILADRTIATKVKTTFILHKNLIFVGEETEGNVVEKEIGNAKMDTEITFKYGMRTMKVSKVTTEEKKEVSKEGEVVSQQISRPDDTGELVTNPSQTDHILGPTPAQLPFQLQIEYTDTDGMKALRVITQIREVTKDREKAESHIEMAVIGPYTAQTSANLALKGEYTQARGVAMMNQRLAWRNTRESAPAERKKHYKKMFKNIRTVEQQVSSAQKSERRRTGGRSYSDSEGDDETFDESEIKFSKESCVVGPSKESCVAPSSSSGASGGKRVKSFFGFGKKKEKRTEEVSDDMASDMYNFKHANSSNLLL